MASSSVQIRVEGDGGRGGGMPGGVRRGILSRTKGLRKSVSHRHDKPSTNASIPSRYQAVFYTSSGERGFNTQTPRFLHHLELNDTPGPGSYSTPLSSLNTFTTSSSLAGRGGFASKSHRFPRERRTNVALGPGSYNPPLHSERQDFSSAPVSRFFQRPIAVKSEDIHVHPSPSPATYHPSHSHTEHNHLVTAQAAFKSCTSRSSLSSSAIPSPSHYHIREDLLHPAPSPHCSVFTSKSRRDGLPRPPTGPGPADYVPHHQKTSSHAHNITPASSKTASRTGPYHRQKHYLRISAPAMPLPPLPPSPGPGHYEIQQVPSQPVKKKDVCGFASKADRWRSEVNSNGDSEPGPGSYDPAVPLKKSYFYNIQRKWIF